MDDVRALVDAVHQRLDVEHPMDDYFLNLLGTARLAGPVAAGLKHMRGSIVVLGAYKIREPHYDALHEIANEGGCSASYGPLLKRLAQQAKELGKARLRDCRDALTPCVRGGHWCWGTTPAGEYEAVAQEHKAWEHFGAAPRDLTGELAEVHEQLVQMEELHGGCDPLKWKWGVGTPCADVHEADAAKWKYEALKDKIAALAPSASSATHSVVRAGGESSEREHSRSPRR